MFLGQSVRGCEILFLRKMTFQNFRDSQFAGRIVAFRPEGVVPYVEREETAIEKTKICLFGLTQNDVPKQSGRPSDLGYG